MFRTSTKAILGLIALTLSTAPQALGDDVPGSATIQSVQGSAEIHLIGGFSVPLAKPALYVQDGVPMETITFQNGVDVSAQMRKGDMGPLLGGGAVCSITFVRDSKILVGNHFKIPKGTILRADGTRMGPNTLGITSNPAVTQISCMDPSTMKAQELTVADLEKAFRDKLVVQETSAQPMLVETVGRFRELASQMASVNRVPGFDVSRRLIKKDMPPANGARKLELGAKADSATE